MKLKLVSNWRKLRYAISVQLMAASSALLASWMLMPPEWKDALPAWVPPASALAFLASAFVGRFIQQDKVSGE